MIKNGLKKILPPPVNSFMREVNRIVALEEKNQAIMRELMQTVKRQEEQIEKQEKLLQQQEKVLKEQSLKTEQQMRDWFDNLNQKNDTELKLLNAVQVQQENLNKDVQAARNHAWQSQQNTKELLWADIFGDISSGRMIKVIKGLSGNVR